MGNESILTFPSLPLPYYLESGMTIYKPGEYHPARRNLGVYDLIVVKKGCLFIGEEESTWALAEGDMLILLPDAYHYAVQECSEETIFYWLHFDTAKNFIQSYDLISHKIQLPRQTTIPVPEQAYALFESLQMLTIEPRSSAFWGEQSVFIELLQQLDPSRTEQSHARVRTVAEQVESYIKTHYREPINNTSLSEHLHYHFNYLTRCMKESYGVTPTEYLLQYRLDQAKRLLLTTPWSISSIAEHVASPTAYFTRRFSARFGMSPLQYRKQFN